MEKDQLVDVYLVCNAKYHDTNFARLELLKLLGENEDIHTRVADSFSDIDGIKASRLLLTYTCDLRPTEAEQEGLAEFLEAGGKWFALHATNSILEFTENGVDAPETAPDVMELLGGQFMAHPPLQPFPVKTEAEEHPLVKGIGEFIASDEEQYLCKMHGEYELLMYSEFSGTCDGWVNSDFNDEEKRPV